jgi:hypothetical protein
MDENPVKCFTMNKNDAVLAVLAASDGKPYSPVQLQKTLFLVDQKLGRRIGGPFFEFQPYDYGPFDSGVYSAAAALRSEGLAEISQYRGSPVRKYIATPIGRLKGEAILVGLGPELHKYFTDLSAWVRAQTFSSLVSSIYLQYPEMKANSVFRE